MITVNSSGAPLSAGFAQALQQPTVSFDMALFANGSQLDGIIKRASLELGAGMAADGMQTFAPCGIFTTQFEAQVFGLGSLSVGDEAEVRVGVLVGQSYEYVTVAHVTVTERSEWQGIATVKGKGRMGLMNAPHGLYEGDYSPASIASAIHAATGVTVSLGAFQGSQNAHIETGGTCRDALASMCARLGGYACEIGGGVSVLPYATGATYPVPESYVTGAELGTAAYSVDGITVRSSSGSFEFGTGRVEVEDATATAETAAVTWGNLQGYSFMPGSLKVAIVDPRVTPADTVGYTYSEGSAQTSRNVPARGISITFDGGYFGTYTAAGLTSTDEGELVEGPLASKVADAYQLAREAEAVARATGQYFWHDSNGAHVSTEALNPTGPSNSLWNSLGLLIRKAANNLVSITQSAIAFYDGLGNAASNIVASFGASGAQVGRDTESSIIIKPDLMVFNNDSGVDVGSIEPSGGTTSISRRYRTSSALGQIYDGESLTLSIENVHPVGCYSVYVRVYISSTGRTDSWTYSLNSPNSSDTSQTSRLYVSVRTSDAVSTFTFQNHYGAPAIINQVVIDWAENGSAPMFRFGDNAVYGEFAFAEGHGTTAYSFAHAEGYGTYAGQYGHAEGYGARASGTCSHAEGNETIAGSSYQHASGKYNVADNSGTYAEIVGNGTSDSARSNARTLDWNGNEVLSGTSTATAHNGFRGRRNLSASDNIDTIFNTGIYYIPSGTNVGGTFPSGVTGVYGSLICTGNATETSTGWIGKQLLVFGTELYVRAYGGSPRAWGAWVQMVGGIPVSVANGGTGASTASPNRVFAGPSSGTSAAAPSFRALVAADVPSLAASKITSGTLALARGGTAADNTATAINTVFAGPSSGSAGNASWRKLVAADIPNLNTSKLTAGTLGIARGGTGSSTVVSVLANTTRTVLAWGPLVMVQLHGATGTPSATATLNSNTLASYKPAYNASAIVADTSGHLARLWVDADTGSIKLAAVNYTSSSSWYGTLVYMRVPS